MFRLKDSIFSFFGNRDKRNDTFKDSSGKGIHQRFTELIAEDFDNEILPKIDNLVGNTIDPFTALDQFVPLLERMVGDPVKLEDTLATRRKMLQLAIRFYSIKGTSRIYDLLFRILGYDTIIITEHFESAGFDHPSFTFDDPRRIFDQACPPCTDYSIDLIGSVTLTGEIRETIFRIVQFVQPIDTRLRAVTANGSPIVFGVVSVSIADGRLIVDNSESSGTIFTLVDGRLFVDGVLKDNYFVIDGKLFFVN